MTKRKSKAKDAPVVRNTPSVVELEDTGIFKRVTIVGVEHGTAARDEMIGWLNKMPDPASQLTQELEKIVRVVAAVLRRHGREEGLLCSEISKAPSRKYVELDLGDGRRCYSFPSQSSENSITLGGELSDAQDALLICCRLNEALARGTSPEDLLKAYRLGQLTQRLYVRQFEHNALADKRRRAGQDNKRNRRRTRARERFTILRDDDPHGDKGPLVERICEEQRISRRAAETYLTGLE